MIGHLRLPDTAQLWALTPRALQVYARIVHHSDRAGLAWPSVETLAAALGTDPRTVRRALAEISAAGLIQRQGRRRGRGTLYKLAPNGTLPFSDVPRTNMSAHPGQICPVRKNQKHEPESSSAAACEGSTPNRRDVRETPNKDALSLLRRSGPKALDADTARDLAGRYTAQQIGKAMLIVRKRRPTNPVGLLIAALSQDYASAAETAIQERATEARKIAEKNRAHALGMRRAESEAQDAAREAHREEIRAKLAERRAQRATKNASQADHRKQLSDAIALRDRLTDSELADLCAEISRGLEATAAKRLSKLDQRGPVWLAWIAPRLYSDYGTTKTKSTPSDSTKGDRVRRSAATD